MAGWRKRWPVAALLLGGCTTAFWDQSGATRLSVARDSEACYRQALGASYPAALPGPARPPGSAVPAVEPPPALWRRSPAQAALPSFEAEQRYAHCMRERGYWATRPSP
jgi:hypothetical protein